LTLASYLPLAKFSLKTATLRAAASTTQDFQTRLTFISM